MPSRSPVTVPPPSPAVSTHSRLRKSHSQRFHRRFPEVDPDEPLLDYFDSRSRCGGGDERMYSQNHSKCSRNMHRRGKIWLSSADPDLSIVEDSESGNTSSLVPNMTEDEDSGTSERRLSTFIGPLPRLEVQLSPSRRVSRRHSEISKPLLASVKRKSVSGGSLFALSTKPSWFVAKDYFSRAEDMMFGLYRLPRTTLLLLLTTVLLAVLLLSATVLLYRITVVHHKVTLMEDWQQHKHKSAGTLESRARSQLLREEILRINENLKQRIGLLTQVRQSFEQLFKATSQLPRLCNRQVEHPASRP